MIVYEHWADVNGVTPPKWPVSKIWSRIQNGLAARIDVDCLECTSVKWIVNAAPSLADVGLRRPDISNACYAASDK
jgi:hypothetical protein